MEERKTILDVKDLSVDFDTDQGTVYAVRDVSFHVKSSFCRNGATSAVQKNREEWIRPLA